MLPVNCYLAPVYSSGSLVRAIKLPGFRVNTSNLKKNQRRRRWPKQIHVIACIRHVSFMGQCWSSAAVRLNSFVFLCLSCKQGTGSHSFHNTFYSCFHNHLLWCFDTSPFFHETFLHPSNICVSFDSINVSSFLCCNASDAESPIQTFVPPFIVSLFHCANMPVFSLVSVLAFHVSAW